MTENEFWHLLDGALVDYRKHIAYRDEVLFTEFLPQGYQLVTLSCVPQKYFYTVLFVKCNLGMFITLIDDFADNPKLRNRELLDKLYQVPFDDEFIELDGCSVEERGICELALKLRANMKKHIRKLPGFLTLYDVFKFDFEEVMRANAFSELITDRPDIVNPEECRHYGAYNMGMVLAGMIDLMSVEEVSDPLGRLREVFLLGQRHGRLSNLLSTLDREKAEADQTNELVALSEYRGVSLSSQLAAADDERAQILRSLDEAEVSQFKVDRYASGLRKLHELHTSMIGSI